MATDHRPRPRIAFVTIGQAPRPDVVPDLLGMLQANVDYQEFGALDGLERDELAAWMAPRAAPCLYTRLRDGSHVEVASALVIERLAALLQRLDGGGFDLIVLITTGVFQPFPLRTKLVHGQRALDAWIAALVVGDCRIGVIYPLAQQAAMPGHGTLIQNANAVAAIGEAVSLDEAAERLGQAELVLMHSVGYTEENARQVAAATGKPVVTARRIIAGAMRLHLTEPFAAVPLIVGSLGGAALIERLGTPPVALTPREREVLCGVLDGEPNKMIGRRLGISHRTVEIHRARALAKLEAASAAELIRRALIGPSAGA